MNRQETTICPNCKNEIHWNKAKNHFVCLNPEYHTAKCECGGDLDYTKYNSWPKIKASIQAELF